MATTSPGAFHLLDGRLIVLIRRAGPAAANGYGLATFPLGFAATLSVLAQSVKPSRLPVCLVPGGCKASLPGLPNSDADWMQCLHAVASQLFADSLCHWITSGRVAELRPAVHCLFAKRAPLISWL